MTFYFIYGLILTVKKLLFIFLIVKLLSLHIGVWSAINTLNSIRSVCVCACVLVSVYCYVESSDVQSQEKRR